MSQEINRTEARTAELNLFGLSRLIVANLKLIIILTLIAMALVAIKVYLTPNFYKSSASILPTGKADKFSELKQLAGLGGSDNDENSSELFPVILESQTIRDAILEKEYYIDSESKSISLKEYFGNDNQDRLRDALAGITTVYTESYNGVIRIEVETDSPQLSQSITRDYLNELENYNMNKRRSRAKENEQYLARQIEQMNTELETLENNLESYQMANRNWDMTSDPEIIKTIARFKRDIATKSSTYVFLQEQYEVAKLDAQKDIPIVRVLDKPSLPTMKSGPRRKLSILMGGVAMFLFSIIFVIGRDTIRRRYIDGHDESIGQLKNELTDKFPRSTRLIKMVRKRSETILSRDRTMIKQ